MPHHSLRNRHIMIHLPIMHLKNQPHKIWQYGSAAGLGFYWGGLLAWLWADDGESVGGGELVRVALVYV